MDAAYWLVSVGSIGMLVGSVALQIRTYSRRRPVRPIVIALGQAAAFGSMVAFSIVLGRPPGLPEWVLILASGLAAGAAYGRLVRVEQTAAGIVMAYSLPWLVVWGGLMLATQGAAAITGRLPWVVCSCAIFSMSLNLGMNGQVVARYRALRIGGVVAAALAAPFLVGLLALAPAGAHPVRADANGRSCAADQIPELLRGLVPPEGTLVEQVAGQAMVVDAWTDTSGRNAVRIVYHVALPDTGLAASITDGVVVNVYRDSGQARAEYDVTTAAGIGGWSGAEDVTGVAGPAIRMPLGPQSSNGTEYLEYWYVGLAGAAEVNVYPRTAPGTTPATSHDKFFAFMMSAAGALDPGAVFALAATGSCSGGAAPVPTNGPGTSGRTTTPGTGVAGIGGLLDGAPIQPGELTQTLLVANGLLLLGSMGQLLLSGGSLPGGLRAGSPTGLPPADGTPVGDGRVWYRAPWEEGGPMPMSPAEIAGIESMQRQGLIWSTTDGWVTPEQGAANEAMRAHQSQINRAEADQAAAEDHQRIQAARDAQAAARQEMRNLDRRAEIYTEMRAAERQHAQDMTDLAWADAEARAVNAIDTVGDLAATGLGIFGGPAGIKVRAAYRILHGAASGWGSALADHAGIAETETRIAIGTVEGTAAAGAEMAIDAGTRKVLGLPPMFPPEPAAVVIPPALLVPKAIMKQALGDAAEIAKTKGVDAAARTVDPAKVMRLFRNGGMKTLAELEQAGGISAEEAQIIRKVYSNQLNECVAYSTRNAAAEFEARTGVRLKEVLVGNSGSTATGRAGSVLTDTDATYMGSFHPDDLAAYAREHGISEAEASSRLNAVLTKTAGERVADHLGAQGLTPKDVGYTGYSGFGEAAGPADSYAGQYTRTRMAAQGKTLVLRPNGTTYQVGGDAILDQEALAAKAAGVEMPPVQPSIPASEFEQLAGRQVDALVKYNDPKSVAKAMERISDLSRRSGIPVDSVAAEAAKAIGKDLGSANAILKAAGLTPDEFRTRALDASMRFVTKLQNAR